MGLYGLYEMEKRIRRIEERMSALEGLEDTKTDISEIISDKESVVSKVVNIANGVKTQSIVIDKNGCITINIEKEKDECGKDREYPWALY